MAKEIEPKLQTIGAYLKKSDIFRIPEYQRAYSWDTSNCDKLWQDIESYIDQDAEDPYFFGTIIIGRLSKLNRWTTANNNFLASSQGDALADNRNPPRHG